jgi:hypothetical protein
MKKLMILLFVFVTVSFAKAQISEGKLSIDKVDKPAVTGIFRYSPEIVSYVLADDLKYRGFGKGDDKKGLVKYTEILFPEISSEKIDFYYKVVLTDKKDENVSTVYLLVSKGYENFLSSAENPVVISSTISYLTSLGAKFEARKLDVDIATQEDVVKKAEDDYNASVKEDKNLNDKLKSLQDEIEQNKKKMEGLKSGMEKEQILLETLKSRKR